MDMATDQQVLRQSTYNWLIGHKVDLPNSQLLATMLASQLAGLGVLPIRLGLGADEFDKMLQRHFNHLQTDLWSNDQEKQKDDVRFLERDDLIRLLLSYRAEQDQAEEWMASIVTDACMGSDHLWQDLGLINRRQLSDLMKTNFPALAEKNDQDMKWKKFIYKQLCIEEGIYVCRAPSCEVCDDYSDCFGPEE